MVKGVPTVSVEEKRGRVSEVMREYGDVVNIDFQMWEGTMFRTGDVEVRLRVAGREAMGKVSDWPRALRWDLIECKVLRVRGTEEEEEDLLMALWEMEGAVEQRAKAWETFEEVTVVEEIDGRKVQVDKKAWEREQERQVQKDLLVSFKEKIGAGMVPLPGFTGGLGDSQHAPRQKRVIGKDEPEFFVDLDEEEEEGAGTRETTSRILGQENEREDVVMKGTQYVSFGVSDITLGGLVVGVEGEHSGVVEGGDTEGDSGPRESKRPMTPGTSHIGGTGWLLATLNDLVADKLVEVDFCILRGGGVAEYLGG